MIRLYRCQDVKYVAADGRVFTGDNSEALCRKYEADTTKMIENRLKNELLGMIYTDNSSEFFVLARNKQALDMINDWFKFKKFCIDYKDNCIALSDDMIDNVVYFTYNHDTGLYNKPEKLSVVTTRYYERVKHLVDINSMMQYNYGVSCDVGD